MSRVIKIFCARFRCIDAATGTIRIKSRPVLIVHEPDRVHDTEFTVLPVSSGRTCNIRCDVCLEAVQGLTLARTSYIRTHKQMAVYTLISAAASAISNGFSRPCTEMPSPACISLKNRSISRRFAESPAFSFERQKKASLRKLCTGASERN